MLHAKRCSSPAINTQIVCRKEKGGRQFETPSNAMYIKTCQPTKQGFPVWEKVRRKKIRKSAQTTPLANACENKTRNIIVSLTETCQIPPSLAIDERGSHQSTPDEGNLCSRRHAMSIPFRHFPVFPDQQSSWNMLAKHMKWTTNDAKLSNLVVTEDWMNPCR